MNARLQSQNLVGRSEAQGHSQLHSDIQGQPGLHETLPPPERERETERVRRREKHGGTKMVMKSAFWKHHIGTNLTNED